MSLWLAMLGGLAVGASFGLIGAGGAILTVPLVLALGAEPKPAIAVSLVVVAVTAGAAAVGHARAGRAAWQTALLFGPTTMLGGYIGGRAAGHASGDALMLGFALLMLGAELAMWRPRAEAAPAAQAPNARRLVAIALLGALVGAVTGLVGARVVVADLAFVGTERNPSYVRLVAAPEIGVTQGFDSPLPQGGTFGSGALLLGFAFGNDERIDESFALLFGPAVLAGSTTDLHLQVTLRYQGGLGGGGRRRGR
jgi:hypothetical protein